MNAIRDAETGKFIQLVCTDPNCDGVLIASEQWGKPSWSCNGLTHDTDDGPLRACTRWFKRALPNE